MSECMCVRVCVCGCILELIYNRIIQNTHTLLDGSNQPTNQQQRLVHVLLLLTFYLLNILNESFSLVREKRENLKKKKKQFHMSTIVHTNF